MDDELIVAKVGGALALLRNLGGMAGLGLLSTAVLGGAFGWAGPMADLLIAERGAGPPPGHVMGLADPAAARPRRRDLRLPGERRRTDTDPCGDCGNRAASPARKLSDDDLQGA